MEKDKTDSAGAFILGNLCMLVATIFWGANVAVTKALIPEWMTPSGITVVRLIGGTILFWIVSLFVKTQPIRKEDWKKIITAGVFGLFAFIALFILSLKYANAIDISIIMTLPPMFVILMGVVFKKNRPDFLVYAGVVISFIGAVIVIMTGASAATKGGTDVLLGCGLALLSCVAYAFYLFILVGPSKEYHPVNLLRWVFLFSAIPAFVFVPGMEDLPILQTRETAPWLEITFILFCPTFLAYFLVQPAMKTIGPMLVSIYQYLLPVFAAITAIWMGLENLRESQCIAMIVIVGGMVMTNIGKKRTEEKKLAREESAEKAKAETR